MNTHILDTHGDFFFYHFKRLVHNRFPESPGIGNKGCSYLREGKGVLQIHFGGAHVKAALQLVFNRTDNLSLVLDAGYIGNFKYHLDHGNNHIIGIVYIKMDGLRSMRRWKPVSGVFLSIFLLLALVFPLRAEEPSEEVPEHIAGDLTGEITEEISGEIPPKTSSDEITEVKKKGSSRELFGLSLGDTSVSLRIYGRWKGTLNGSLGFALTPFGAEALRGETPFFMQEGDITLSLWIRDRWFLEAGFMDNSALNTYRLGYQGLEGEFFRYVGIGNTGLDFPSFPYLDLGGDSVSSFGAYGHFSIGNLGLHSLVRYDAAAREERVFVGNRERSFGFVDLSRPIRGTSFVLPDNNISDVRVFIQDNKGTLTEQFPPPLSDKERRWRLAESSEFGVSAVEGRLELTLGKYTGGVSEPEGMIAVSYTKGGLAAPWIPSLQDGYGTPGLPESGFLGDIQRYFDDAGKVIRLSAYPQPGQMGAAAIPGTVTIAGYQALVIYEPGAFSPFEKQNRYQAPASSSSSAELVKLSTGELIPGYQILAPLDKLSAESLIFDNDQFLSQRGVYELIPEGPRKPLEPQERWPLVNKENPHPELYLPGRLSFTEDLGIRFTNYSSAGAFNIGTDVVPGSVQVFRNGISDPNFSYSSSSGTVTLRNPAGFSEVIRISYLKQSSETRLGSLAAGVGAIWDPSGPFSGKLGLGLRWNVTSGAFSENGASSPGTVGLGAEAKWEHERLRAGLTFGLGFEQPDTTGLYRASGMEESEWILPLPAESSFITNVPSFISPPAPPFSFLLSERADLVYRSYRDSSVLTGTTLSDISGKGEVINRMGPYPAIDNTLASQVLVAEFEFSDTGNPLSDKTWTGFETPLGLNGEFLERAGKIKIPYRFMRFSEDPPADGELTVYIQIGALADKDSGNPENPNLLIQHKLFIPDTEEEYNSADFHSSARIATINLTDDDRSRLQGAKYLRILVVWNKSLSSAGSLSGRVILAPPIVWGANWRPVTVRDSNINPSKDFGSSGPNVNAYEDDNSGALGVKYANIIGRLHSGSARQRVLEIFWNNPASFTPGEFSDDGTGPGADGRIPAIPLSDYRSLSFFVRAPKAGSYINGDENDPLSDQHNLDSGTLNFILAQGPGSLKKQGEIALHAKIPLTVFKENGVAPGEWTRVDIQYRDGSRRILVNGNIAGGAELGYFPAAAAKITGENSMAGNTAQGDWDSMYAAFFMEPATITSSFPGGSIAFDEIFLEDPSPSYRLNNGASVEWSKPGAILKIRNFALISDFSLQAAIETGARGNPFDGEKDGSFGMNGHSRAEVSVLGARLAANYLYSMNTFRGAGTDFSWSAGHSLSRSFGLFSVRESFDDAPADKTMNHRLSMSLDTRVRAALSGEVFFENERLRRFWQLAGSGRPSPKVPLGFDINASAGITEKTSAGEKKLYNYAGAWAYSFGDLIPDSGSGAERRDLQGNFSIRLDTSPVGSGLFFRGSSLFSDPDELNQAGSLMRLDFPVSIKKGALRMLFRIEREYRRNVFTLSPNLLNDTKNWGQSFADAAPMMFSVPFYSLFASSIEKNMLKFSTRDGTDLSQFADRYEFSVQRAQGYGLLSFFFPGRFTFRISRTVERKLETPRDSLNLSAGLNFSSINMFGAMGSVPIFKFYKNDEFSHSLQTQISFPRSESVSWNVRSDLALRFHGFSGAELIINNNLIINSSYRIGEGSRWTDSLSASWIVPMESTLFGKFYGFLMGLAGKQSSWLTLANLASMEYELLRMETLEFVMERVPSVSYGDYYRFYIIAGHESIVRIFGKLNFSVFGKVKMGKDFSTDTFSFLGTVGTSLHLMF